MSCGEGVRNAKEAKENLCRLPLLYQRKWQSGLHQHPTEAGEALLQVPKVFGHLRGLLANKKGVEMPKYKFKLAVDYEVEAEDEEEALYQLADLIRRDWPYYLDEGELEKVETPLTTKEGR